MTIAGLERFRPNVYAPPEFSRFWALLVAELQSVAPETVTEDLESPDSNMRLTRILFTSIGGVQIEGYLLCPTTSQACPLIVHAHGYNDRFDIRYDWAARGFNVLGFDARGFGRSASAVELSEYGYVLTGIESPETSILRGAVADYLQAVRVGKELLTEKISRVGYYGFSFGGGLAFMAGALSRDAALTIVGQPTFGWNDERFRLALAGSALEIKHYIEKHPWRRDSVIDTLRYFDTLHFAPIVRAPVFLGIGLDDDVVPSRSLLAVANHIHAPVELRFLPVSHSEDPREALWGEFIDEWMGYLSDGVPEGFGQGERQVRGVAV